MKVFSGPGFSLLLSLVLALGLGGCASSSVPTVEPTLTPLARAVADLDEAKRLNAEWMVANPLNPEETVSLSRLLAMSRQYQLQEEHRLATFLAEEISKFAKLGIVQALGQANPTPYYDF